MMKNKMKKLKIKYPFTDKSLNSFYYIFTPTTFIYDIQDGIIPSGKEWLDNQDKDRFFDYDSWFGETSHIPINWRNDIKVLAMIIIESEDGNGIHLNDRIFPSMSLIKMIQALLKLYIHGLIKFTDKGWKLKNDKWTSPDDEWPASDW